VGGRRGYWGNIAAALAASSFAACGAAPEPASRAGGQGSTLSVAGTVDGAGAQACVEPPAAGSPVAKDRDAAALALLQDRPREAIRLLEPIVRKRPNDLAAQALFVAATERAKSATRKASDGAKDLPVTKLETPPATYSLKKAVPGVTSPSTVKLVVQSNKPNLITDDAAWFKANGISPSVSRPRGSDIPEHVAGAVPDAGPLQMLFHQPTYDVAAYGTALGVFAPGKLPRLFDAKGPMTTSSADFLGLDYAVVTGDTLLVQTSRNGYSKEVGGKTAYISAYDFTEGTLRWQSDALVANASDFVVTNDAVISGYGFTAEPDFLFVLDLATGKTLSKVSVPSGPTELSLSGDRLLVRTYDHDLLYRVEPTPSAAAPPNLAAGRVDPSLEVDAATRCYLSRAIAAVDARDPNAIAEATKQLVAHKVEEPVAGAFDGVRRFLEQQAGSAPAIDLSTRALVVAEPPPWDAKVPANVAPRAGTPRWIQKSRAAADPVRSLRGRDQVREGRPAFIAPAENGKLPKGARGDTPTSYGLEDLRAIIPNGSRTILIYGGRHVVVVDGSALVAAVDMSAYMTPPKANPQWAEFAIEDATYAREEGGVLYVCNGGGSYAKEVFGKKGFISAIDEATGRLLWRSDPLVCNSTFDFVDDLLVTGYGFTDEPDFVFAIRKDSGQTVAKVHVDSGPEEVSAQGRAVHVEAYAHTYDFELTP